MKLINTTNILKTKDDNKLFKAIYAYKYSSFCSGNNMVHIT